MDRQLLFAIELLRQEIAHLPLAVASNAARSAQAAPQSGRRDPMTMLSYSANGSGGFAVPGTATNPLNVPRAAPPGRGARVAGAAGQLAAGGFGKLQAATATLGGAFGKLLGPLGMVTTFLTSSASGFSVLNGAMDLFASSFGAVVMPVMYALSVAFVAGADVINRKLIPVMSDFTKSVLNSAVPAIESLANIAGKAATALAFLTNNKLTRLMSDDRGGMLGALDRTIDRVSDDTPSGPQSDGSRIGRAKNAHRIADDLATLFLGPIAGNSLAGAKNWSMKKILGQEADPYSGPGVTGGKKSEGAEATERARQLVMQQLQFSTAPRANISNATGNWSRAQMASLGMSPFERENLKNQREILAQLIKGNSEVPASGAYTDLVGEANRLTAENK